MKGGPGWAEHRALGLVMFEDGVMLAHPETTPTALSGLKLGKAKNMPWLCLSNYAHFLPSSANLGLWFSQV